MENKTYKLKTSIQSSRTSKETKESSKFQNLSQAVPYFGPRLKKVYLISVTSGLKAKNANTCF